MQPAKLLLKVPEAAEMLAMPLGTIKSYVLRGREKLRGMLGDKS